METQLIRAVLFKETLQTVVAMENIIFKKQKQIQKIWLTIIRFTLKLLIMFYNGKHKPHKCIIVRLRPEGSLRSLR